MKNYFEPGLDRKGFLKVGDGLLDVLVFKEILGSKGGCSGEDNVLPSTGGD